MSEAASKGLSAEPSADPSSIAQRAPAEPGAALPDSAWRAWAAGLPMALLLLDPDGRPVWANRAFEALSGLPADAAGPWAACPDGDAQPVSASGAAVACQVRRLPLPGGCVGVSFEDRRALAEAQARRQDLTRWLDMAQEFGRLGRWERELPSLRGRWDRHMFDFWGLPPADEAPSIEQAAQAQAPEDGMAAAFLGSLNAPGRHERRFRVRQPGGEVRHLHAHWEVEADPQGTPVRVMGVMLDDTEAWQRSLEVEQTRQQLQLAIDLAHIGIWRHDFASNRLYYNDEAFRVIDVTPRAEGLTLDEVRARIHPDDIPQVVASAQQALATDAPTDMEARYRRSDGQWRQVLTRRVVQRDAAGLAVGFVGVALDVTDARDAAQARQEAQLLQRESQAKSEFLARVSHELRTPLNAVLGFTQLLLIEGDRTDDEARRRRLEHIRAAGEHLLALINDVLDLSRLESGGATLVLQPVALAPALADAAALVEGLARAHQVRLQVEPATGTALADPTRLRQVLVNLLTNAIKYNRIDGRVVLAARGDGPEVVLTVADSGVGMTPEQARHAFEPFNRLGAERRGIEGTGIGLAIVRTLVERMRGRISLHSEAGAGSVFEVHLQAAVETAAPPDTPGEPLLPAAVVTPLQAMHRLLYIEDNPVNVLIVSELVSRRGDVMFVSCPDGQSGVERAQALRPDLVLVDMQLPDIDGFEVLRLLRERDATARVPCIALSANALPETISRALSAGFADYWTKPLDFRAFVDALEALFGPPRVQ